MSDRREQQGGPRPSRSRNGHPGSAKGRGERPARGGQQKGSKEEPSLYRGEYEPRREGRDGRRSRDGRPDGRRPDRPRSGGSAPEAGRATRGRQAALETLQALRQRDGFAQEVLGSKVDKARMPRPEKAFATRLVLGVVSLRGTLDEVLDRCLNSPTDVDDTVRDALLVSVYEMVYLQKESHVAVDQGVELVRSVAPRAAGLANAVLRRVAKARDAFPFGDPSHDLDAYARLHGFPRWLAERLIRDLGADGAHRFMMAANEPAPVFVAVNAAKASDAEVLQVLCAARSEPDPVDVAGELLPGCFRLADASALNDGRVLRLINDGKLLVSDAASQAVAARVAAAADGSFLEVGAGRGTKTILVQSDRVRAAGQQLSPYLTVDNHGYKSRILAERARCYGIEVADALTGNATDLSEVVGDRAFDTVFIDAPCTGLGTLRRHVDIRWRLTPQAIDEHAQLDGRLLASAAAHVAPGGLLAYSTCTVTPEENDQVLDAFLESEAGASFEVEPAGVAGERFFRTAVAPGGCDGHFLGLLRRRA